MNDLLKIINIDCYFDSIEEEMLMKSIETIYKTSQEVISPRFIRSFTFKYLLARDICRELGYSQENISSLLEQNILNKSGSKDNRSDESVERIIQQVV